MARLEVEQVDVRYFALLGVALKLDGRGCTAIEDLVVHPPRFMRDQFVLDLLMNGVWNTQFRIDNPDSTTALFAMPILATGKAEQVGSGVTPLQVSLPKQRRLDFANFADATRRDFDDVDGRRVCFETGREVLVIEVAVQLASSRECGDEPFGDDNF